MICPKCGGDTFIMVSDVGLKCENCGYVYSIEVKKWKERLNGTIQEIKMKKVCMYDILED